MANPIGNVTAGTVPSAKAEQFWIIGTLMGWVISKFESLNNTIIHHHLERLLAAEK
jgi:hypothetical protein